MTLAKIAPNTILRNFLRGRLTDVSTSRSGDWIFDDWPRIQDLGNNSFPRISVIVLDESGEWMGIFDDTSLDTVTLQVDCWTKKELMCQRTKTDESLGTISASVNSNRLVTEFVPTTVTNIKHNSTSYGTVTFKDTDALFTAPGSLASDTVEVSKATGNLNFSSADVSGHSGQTITTTYVVKLEGEALVKYLAREVVKAIRTNWRTDATFNGLFLPQKVSGPKPIDFEQDMGVYRYSIDYQVHSFNIGEGI